MRLLPLLVFLLIATPAVAQKTSDGVMPITTDSEAARDAFLSARDHLNNVEINAAREALDVAIAADENFVLALAYQARITEPGAMRDDLMQRVDADLNTVSDGERMLVSAMKQQQRGTAKAALQSYKKLAKMYPNDADAQFMLGAMYLNMQDSEKSRSQLTRVTEIDPSFAAAYNLLGYQAMYEGEAEAAEAAFKKYVALRPDQANPYDSLAEFYMKQGRFTEAVDSYRKAFAVDNRYVSAKARAGVALALSGDTDAARTELRQALKLSTDPAEKTGIYSDLSNTYLFDDNVDGAIAVLDEGVTWAETVSPDRAAFLTIAKAWVYGENSRTDEADKMTDIVAAGLANGRYSMDNEPFLRSRVDFGRAMTAISRNDLDQAQAHIDAFEAYVEASGSTSSIQDLHEVKAAKAFAEGDVNTAIDHMNQAGDQPHIHYHLGQMHAKAQNADLAREHLRRAAQANENSRSFALVRNRALQAMGDGN